MITVVYEKENNRSAAYDGNIRIGCCEYVERPKEWVITHTEVYPQYGGRGIARKLVTCVAEQAEKEGIRVVPLCSYARKVLG